MGAFWEMPSARSPAERAVALALKAGTLTPPERKELAGLLKDCPEAELGDIAGRHVLGPLLYFRLKELGLASGLPEALARNLKRDYAVASVRAASMQEDLSAALAAFERSGVRAAPIKGAYLAWRVYPEPGLRPMSDFDFLCPAADVGRAADALRGLGYSPATDDPAVLEFYREHFHAAPMVKQGSTAVELHSGCAAAPAGEPAAAMLSRARESRLLDRPALELDAADHLAVVACHLLTHRQPTLLAVCDVAMLAARVADWSGFAGRIEPRFRPAAGAALALAGDLLGAEAPPELAGELIDSGGARARRLLRRAPAEIWSRRLRGLALLGTTVRGWRALFPSRGQTAVTFGVDSRSPGFILWRLVHPLRQMAVGLGGLLALKP